MKLWRSAAEPLERAGKARLHTHRGLALLLALAAALSTFGFGGAASPSIQPNPSGGPKAAPPVLAYYYMWFNKASWTHTKTDLPALGPYTSTDQSIIHQHVLWAKESGIDGFIVSWKHTPALDLALSELVSEADSQGLKLVLIYEGLDVNRNPISSQTVKSDLVWFMQKYGSERAFDLYGKPAIVWSGTWRFSDSDIADVRSTIGAPSKVLLLGSEKSAIAYKTRASLFDGDAYYWSSADPLTTPGYQQRLTDLGAIVHQGHGLWLAPAASGFDARLNGGTTVVDRRDGATLTAAWRDAQATNPDGIAIISWNEFTENSYIEPSRNYGMRYLQVLSLLTGAPGPQPAASTGAGSSSVPSLTPAASSTPAGRPSSVNRNLPPYDQNTTLVIGALGILLLVAFGLGLRLRAMRQESGRSGGGRSRRGGTAPFGRSTR